MSKSPFSVSNQIKEATENYVMQAKIDEWCAKRGLKKQVYFDTYDAIHLIQGIWGLWEYKRGFGSKDNRNAYKLNVDLLQSANTLVHSFAFRKKLGTIRLLPPHQDELAEKIREDKRWFFAKDTFELTQELWYKLGVMDLLDDKGNLTIENFQQYQKRSKARDLYIAKDLLLEPFWQDRYNSLFKRNKIITWDESTYNIADITGRPEFKIILNALDEERKGVTTNEQKRWERSNYADAIAFCILKERLDAFKRNKDNNPLPIFFASRTGTYSALKKVMATESGKDMFSFTFTEEGRTWSFPVIRDAHYFVLDSIFNLDDGEKEDGLHDLFLNLRNVCDRVVSDYDLLDNIFGKGTKKELETKVEDLLEDAFFTEIWAKHESYKEIRVAVEANREHRLIAEAEDERHEKEREKIIAGINRDTEKFRLANDIIESLFGLNELDPNDESYFKNIGTIDVFSDLSMVRFSFNKICRTDIQNYVKEILRTRHTDDFKEHTRALLRDIMDGLENYHKPNPQNKKSVTRLTVGLAVLWVFKKYELIVQIAKHLNPNAGKKDALSFPNYHIPLLYSASLCRIHEEGNLDLAKNLAECVWEKFSPESNQPNYKAWLGLSYVWWSIWNKHHDNLEMPEEIGKAEFHKYQKQPEFKFVQKSQKIATEVIAYLTKVKGVTDKVDRHDVLSQRDQKYYYAINISIFLTILHGSKEEFLSEKTQKYLQELERQQGHQSNWHSRFYDTCARFYYRRALLAENTNIFDEMLRLSKRDNETCTRVTLIYEGVNYNRALENAIVLKQAAKFKRWKSEYRQKN